MTDFEALEKALAEREARAAVAGRASGVAPKPMDPDLKRFLATQEYHEVHQEGGAEK
jgi:hypothetical protein